MHYRESVFHSIIMSILGSLIEEKAGGPSTFLLFPFTILETNDSQLAPLNRVACMKRIVFEEDV